MSGFSADWLALREPADRAARDSGLLRAAARLAGPAPVILDLGCGSGALLRHLAPHLAAGQRWRCIDGDAALLDVLRRSAPHDLALETHCLDLRALDALPLQGATLVAASALFDLVSEPWLTALIARMAALRLPLYAGLTYDGIAEWLPTHSLDGAMRDALNRHQHLDKGFGLALGPQAPERLDAALRGCGYVTRTAESPWRLDSEQAALQIAMAQGFADCARALTAAPEAAIDAWLEFRRSAACSGTLRIGHRDLSAYLG